MPAYLNAIGTAVPDHDIHHAFVDWATAHIDDPRAAKLFQRMAHRSGIAHRFTVLPRGDKGGSPVDVGGFYYDRVPGTAERMRVYAEAAPRLACQAVDALAAGAALGDISHLVVASCTGFVAPGIDQIIARTLGLRASVERLLVGYMGCYAAVASLRQARHIVRSEPEARVLVICVELSSLHLQKGRDLEGVLAMLQFGDGAAAALVTGEAKGVEIGAPFAQGIAESDALIQWHIGDTGFEMTLSGQVPGTISTALAKPDIRARLIGGDPVEVDGWAVHAGGRSILDAVEQGLGLGAAALDDSRAVLQANGNMSSATLMFVLARMLKRPALPRRGVALAFGPGVAAEGFRFAAA